MNAGLAVFVLINSLFSQIYKSYSPSENNQLAQQTSNGLSFEARSLPDATYQYFYHSQPVVFTPTFDSVVVGFSNMPSATTTRDSVQSQLKAMNGEWQIQDTSDQAEVQVGLNTKTTEVGLQAIVQELSQTQGASFVSPVLDWQGTKVHFTNEIFIGFVAGTPAPLIEDFISTNGLALVDDFGDVADQGEIVVVKSNRVPETNAFETANQFILNSIVSYAVPNLVFFRPEEIRSGVSNNPETLATAAMPWYITNIRADEAWGLLSNKPSYSVRVAVIDEGVQRSHEAFPAGSIAPIGYDAVNLIEGPNAGEPKNILYSHGTAVAGTIIANPPPIFSSLRGVGDSFVQVVPVNIVYTNHSTDWLRIRLGIKWAKDHANVLNLSFATSPLQVIDAEISAAVNAGVVVVAAAGNDNSPRVLYPANNSQVIAVGGTGGDEKRWPPNMLCTRISDFSMQGSNYGSELSVMAPAYFLKTTTIGGYQENGCGTSLSSPMVAAVSAMMLLANPSLNPNQIKDILQRTAYRNSYYSWDISPAEGGWNVQMGYGRVDAYKAVEAALYPPKVIVSTGDLTDDGQLVVTWNNNFHHIVYYNNMVHIQNGASNWMTLNGVAPGTYDFYLKTSRGLRKKITQTLYAQPNNNVAISFGNIISGDANNDNMVNLVDFSIWKNEYLHGCSTSPCKADFNYDSTVDLVDFSIWKQAYLYPPHEGGAGDGWTGSLLPVVGSNQAPATMVTAAAVGKVESVGLLPMIGSSPTLTTTLAATTGMSFLLYTDNGSPQVGQTINIFAYLDTNGQVAQGASAVLHYDPAVLELQDNDLASEGIQVTTGDIYTQWYGNTQTNSGWIRLGGEGTDFSGVGLFLTATFHVISSVPYTGFTVTNIPGTVYESLAVQIGSENNFLENDYYGVLPISGNPPRQEPEMSFIVPAYLREDHNQICVQVQNAQDTVRSVDLTVIDSQFNSTNILLEQQDSTKWCGLWDASATPDQIVNLSANVHLLGFDRTASANIILDRTAPVYNSHSFIPIGSQNLEGTDISISAVDNLAGVKTIAAFYNTAPDGSSQGDWVQIGELIGSPGTITWNTYNLMAGQYRVAFAFQDNADNWIWYTDENNNAFVYHNTQPLFLPLIIR